MSKDEKKVNLFAKLADQAKIVDAENRPSRTAAHEAPALPSPAPPKARPIGKRENPAYCQANAYITKATRKEVTRALLDLDGIDYSDLVESLLVKWLADRAKVE